MAHRDLEEPMNSTIIHSILCPKSTTVISDICTGQVHIFHRFLESMGGGAWPFLFGGVICLLNSVDEPDVSLLNSVKHEHCPSQKN